MSITQYGSASFRTRLLEPRFAIVAVDGEVDFTNVKDLIGAATHVARDRSGVVIDLSGVEFFGTAGFAALHALSVRYAARKTHWAVVPSRNVQRVVQICDTDAFVPMRATLASALASL